MAVPDCPAGEVTVTHRLFEIARARADHSALVGGGAAACYSYGDLAATVQAAAAGLAGRGLQPRDVVAIYAPDAACYALATYAIRAAGGVPSPVGTGLTVTEIAGQLADCGARMMLTGPPLAAAAQAAADRSWVRQVISFSEAAGATMFDALLATGAAPLVEARPHDLALLPYARRPDGALQPAPSPITTWPASWAAWRSRRRSAGRTSSWPRRRPGTAAPTPPCSIMRSPTARRSWPSGPMR